MNPEAFFIKAFKKLEKDPRIKPSHISLYISILGFWHENEFSNPINISRKQILLASKIRSKATYHKCINELHQFGYIKYSPSYNPFSASSIFINEFKEVEQTDKPSVKKEIVIRVSIELE